MNYIVEADAESADGNSPSAETRSAPGDLSNGPATLHKRLQHLANERPGTSHEVERSVSIIETANLM